MRLQQYLVRKGLELSQDKQIPKHFENLLSVHKRTRELAPQQQLPDGVDTRGVTK